MLSPADIHGKALNKYPAFLREYFAGRSIFPYQIPFGRPRGASELERFAAESRALVDGSASRIGFGYTVETEIVGTKLGPQRFPISVYFPDIENYLRAIGKEVEFEEIAADIRLIAALSSKAETWARAHPLRIHEKHGQWPDLCLVLNALLDRPRPGCFPRELPLPVSGKLLGTEQETICDILSSIPGPHWTEGTDFYDQLGLRRPPSAFIRLRFLDASLRKANGWPHEEMSVSLDTLTQHPIEADHVFVTENLMTFLAFPEFKGAVVIFGNGKAAERLPHLSWLASRELCYWGDIDPHGMEILRSLRIRFPRLRSMLMDIQILEKYRHFTAAGKPTNQLKLDGLTADERAAAIEVFADGKSLCRNLEQEKLPQSEVMAWLERLATTATIRTQSMVAPAG